MARFTRKVDLHKDNIPKVAFDFLFHLIKILFRANASY